ncbi:MAG TPA: HD domain-containing phosphohydrolase [Terriglobales bacterium]|nr:HD domain-containing phosphohydrolase [Terriglobales bacterium]
MRKINKELWLLLFLVLIAAILNFLVASQRMALVLYFLPVLFSAYYFGRRHATMTASVSVVLVVALTYLNPAIFTHRMDLPFDSRYLDLTLWGGVLVVTGYAMGTLYERNQKSLREMKDGYDGMLVILQNFLANEKYSEAHAYRISMYATKIAEALGLDSGSIEDIRTAALLRNVNELGISNDVLYKAANVSQEEVERSVRRRGKADKAQEMGGSLQRAIPILVVEQRLMKSGESCIDAPIEVQVMALAEAYETLISETGPRRMSPVQAEEIMIKSSGKKYDSMVVDAFVKAFGQQAKGAGA